MEMKFWVAVVSLAILVGKAWPQSQGVDTSCVKKLIPCLNYLNGTRDPPDSCCDPLKSVIKSNPECLCRMISINSTNEAQKAGINVNEAEQLPARCGQHVNPISCLTSSPNAKNSVPNSASSILTPSKSLIEIISILISMGIPILWSSSCMLLTT